MRKGYLSEYFEGVAAKLLVAVEVDQTVSHQHEFNATKDILAFMGRPSDPTKLPTTFIYLTDDDSDPVTEEAFLTLYNARQGKPRAAEYRFYFPTTAVSRCAAEGDLLVIAKRRDGGLLVIVAEGESSIAQQIEWLFGLSPQATLRFSVKTELENDQDRVGFASRFILEQIGVDIEEEAPNFLDDMLSRFGGSFPKTSEFSAYARGTLSDIDGLEAPDDALVNWLDREEVLFRTLERHLVADRLCAMAEQGFKDPEPAVQFLQSVFQRRKSRAGAALENHLQHLFTIRGITFSRSKRTEGNRKPDFIFPGIEHYHDDAFPAARLTMLAAKATCRDRWRQILNEARKVETKHLATLEPGISVAQTTEMAEERVQLVVPQPLHSTYADGQAPMLMAVRDFLELVEMRQQ